MRKCWKGLAVILGIAMVALVLFTWRCVRRKNNDIISGCRKSQRFFRQPKAADITCPPPYGAYPSLWGNLRLSAPIGGERLVDLGLQCLRLLLFRNSAHDGVAHDVAVPVNHIGGGI